MNTTTFGEMEAIYSELAKSSVAASKFNPPIFIDSITYGGFYSLTGEPIPVELRGAIKKDLKSS